MRNPKREENGFEGMYAKIKLSQIASKMRTKMKTDT